MQLRSWNGMAPNVHHYPKQVIMDAPAAAEWTMALYGPGAQVLPPSALAEMLPNASQVCGWRRVRTPTITRLYD